MFKFEKDLKNKRIIITVWGFYTPKIANDFITAYSREISSINPKEYVLIVDPTDLITSKQELIPILQGCFKFYMRDGFRKVYMISPKSPTSDMQLKKIAKQTSFTGEFIKSLSDISN